MRTWSQALRRTLHSLFAGRVAAPLWLILRIHLGLVWLRFGVGKMEGGWLTDNPLRGLLGAVASGGTPVPFDFYRSVADLLLRVGADAVLSVAIPLFEVGVALAFFAGILLVPAAIAAILLNLNLILSGIASWQFDGRIIALQLLLLAGWRGAEYIGLGQLCPGLLRGPRPLRTGCLAG